MKILFSGGGTLGSVTPLIALVPHLRSLNHEMVFIGTPHGPERDIVATADIPFYSMGAPKFPRYLDWSYFLFPYKFVSSLISAWRLLTETKPDVHVTAGGYVSLPIAWVAWVRRIPTVVHQMDVQPGLANRFIAPIAKRISVTFEQQRESFSYMQVDWTGNPSRALYPGDISTLGIERDPTVPLVLIMGGGTGAQGVNDLVSEALCERAQVVHITGRGKEGPKISHERYHAFDFVNQEMPALLHASDLVVSRAGLGSITELAALGKPSIIIPMPNSHQEANAQLLDDAGAAVVAEQGSLTPQSFAQLVESVLQDSEQQAQLSTAIRALMPEDAVAALSNVIIEAGS